MSRTGFDRYSTHCFYSNHTELNHSSMRTYILYAKLLFLFYFFVFALFVFITLTIGGFLFKGKKCKSKQILILLNYSLILKGNQAFFLFNKKKPDIVLLFPYHFIIKYFFLNKNAFVFKKKEQKCLCITISHVSIGSGGVKVPGKTSYNGNHLSPYIGTLVFETNHRHL